MILQGFPPCSPFRGVNAKPNHMVAYFGNKTLYLPIKGLIMFQRRHYKKMAETLATVHNIDNMPVEAVSVMFSRDNPNFSEERFFEAFRKEYEWIWGEPYPFALRGRYERLNA